MAGAKVWRSRRELTKAIIIVKMNKSVGLIVVWIWLEGPKGWEYCYV